MDQMREMNTKNTIISNFNHGKNYQNLIIVANAVYPIMPGANVCPAYMVILMER